MKFTSDYSWVASRSPEEQEKLNQQAMEKMKQELILNRLPHYVKKIKDKQTGNFPLSILWRRPLRNVAELIRFSEDWGSGLPHTVEEFIGAYGEPPYEELKPSDYKPSGESMFDYVRGTMNLDVKAEDAWHMGPYGRNLDTLLHIYVNYMIKKAETLYPPKPK